MEDVDSLNVIFQSGNKFYLWERIPDVLSESKSQDLHQIAMVLSEQVLRGLRRNGIPFLFDPDGLDDES